MSGLNCLSGYPASKLSYLAFRLSEGLCKTSKAPLVGSQVIFCTFPLMAMRLGGVPLASQLTEDERGMGCVAYQQSVMIFHGYKSNLGARIIFVFVFSLSFTLQCTQMAIKRRW